MTEIERRTRLLNPGPVTLSDGVRQAMLRPDLCHREAEFGRLMDDVRSRLECVYADAADEYAAVLITGSGTAAVEAMIGSLVPRNATALVLANGVYGERMADMLRIQGKDAEVLRHDWTSPLDLQETEQRLATRGAFSHVVAVHNETTTGRLNDIARLGQLCRRSGTPLLLDTVSSFGGEEIGFADWNLEACAATANKCIHGVPGVSFVLVRKDVLQRRPSGATSIYLDLLSNHEAQSKSTPLFTPAVQAMYALQQALVELQQHGGWTKRRQRYRDLSSLVRSELQRRGVERLLDDAQNGASMLTAFRLPDDATFARLHAHLKETGFVIYPGQQSLQDIIFRVAVMGDLTDEDIAELNLRFHEFFGRAN